MSKDHQSEAELENQLLRRMKAVGYRYVEIPDEATLMAHFRQVLEQRNQKALAGEPLSDREFKAAINALIGAKSHYQISTQLRGSDVQSTGKIPLQRDDNTNIFLQVFDGKHPEANVYEVTHQMTVQGKHENRYDVLVLINGMPIAQVELKRHGVDFTQAFNQIIRYRNESEQTIQLMKLVQLYVISNGLETRYFANGDGSLNSNFMFYWTDDKNQWINDLDAFTSTFFDIARFHSLVAKYTIFDRVKKQMLIMRPYQIFATEAILKQVKNHPDENGYVWHTTGSGKTITSFKASRLIAQLTDAEKIIFLIDRHDLDKQTIKNFSAYLPETTDGKVGLDATTDTSQLVEQLSAKGHALIVSTIQKMNHAVQNDRYKKVLTPYHDKRVVFIEDEAHRSQFGEMRKNVNRWFQNAQHFGFTGTPIFKENIGADGRTTADMYTKQLHSYLIKDAIRDHNVLPFTIQYINTIKGKPITTDDEDVPGINKKEVLEAPERIQKIAEHIFFNHRRFTQNRLYNAILTVPNTRVALMYYDAFKRINAEADPHDRLNVTTIFTWAANEDDNEEHQDKADLTSRLGLDNVVHDYNRQYQQDFSTDHFSRYFDDVSKRMVDYDYQTPDSNIDILIVVNMFLTGFDSKKLSTLYVDKKLQWHSLIQAYSRTNRIEKNTKPAGNIVCYRNLKKATDAAVRLFSADDKEAFFAPPYAELRDDFLSAIASLRKVTPVPQAVDSLYDQGDAALEKFVMAFRDVMRLVNRIKVYQEFEWDEFKTVFTAQDFEDFRGKYYEAYHQLQDGPKEKPVSILDDVDFDISLFKTDTVDVQYIVGLINSIDLESGDGRNEDVRKIQHLLQNTTDDNLKSKAELLKQFLAEVVATLPPNADIQEALNQFLIESREAAIVGFAKQHGVATNLIEDQVEDFSFYGHLDGDKLNHELQTQKLPFLKLMNLRQDIDSFVAETTRKYSVQ